MTPPRPMQMKGEAENTLWGFGSSRGTLRDFTKKVTDSAQGLKGLAGFGQVATAAKGTAGGGEGAYVCTAACSSGWLLAPKRGREAAR